MGNSAILSSRPVVTPPPVSVVAGRSRRRHDAARAVTLVAQRLATEHGLDGFTMEQLADAVGVSRRTLFNYFPTKDDAVLGELPPVEERALETFRARGPSGRLLLDLGVLATHLIGAISPEPEEVRALQLVLERNPRLMVKANARFEDYVAGFRREIAEREGYAADDIRPRVAVAVVVSLYESALKEFAAGSDRRPFTEIFAETVAAARSLVHE